MEIPFNLILEDIIFGPLLILIMLTIALIFFFPFRKNHKIPFRFIFISWFILLMGSNSLFFKLSIFTFLISTNSTGSMGLHPKNIMNNKIKYFLNFIALQQ